MLLISTISEEKKTELSLDSGLDFCMLQRARLRPCCSNYQTAVTYVLMYKSFIISHNIIILFIEMITVSIIVALYNVRTVSLPNLPGCSSLGRQAGRQTSDRQTDGHIDRQQADR